LWVTNYAGIIMKSALPPFALAFYYYIILIFCRSSLHSSVDPLAHISVSPYHDSATSTVLQVMDPCANQESWGCLEFHTANGIGTLQPTGAPTTIGTSLSNQATSKLLMLINCNAFSDSLQIKDFFNFEFLIVSDVLV
jgi:hypothetical protein